MDQIKIGKFIASRRKECGLTQMQLAQQLGITDRAVSKWENSRALPDASCMLTLCRILGISVTDLLSGEVITVENKNQELEKKLLEIVKEREQAHKQLLTLETVISVTAVVMLTAIMCLAIFLQIAPWLRSTLIAVGFVVFIVAMSFAIRIEQKAGYYACAKCGHRQVPGYWNVYLAPHVNTARYLRCPKCGQRSWQKKVLTKE